MHLFQSDSQRNIIWEPAANPSATQEEGPHVVSNQIMHIQTHGMVNKLVAYAHSDFSLISSQLSWWAAGEQQAYVLHTSQFINSRLQIAIATVFYMCMK